MKFNQVVTAVRAQRAASYIRSVAKRYEGQEVIETFPNGKQFPGVIKRFIWDDSLGSEGDWNIFVLYDDNGNAGKFGGWTSFEVLTFTGVKRS